MKILIMCEGANELKIVNLLLDNNKLKFTRDDLLDMRPFHARQLAYHGNIAIYRIGDKMTDKLKIPKELSPVIQSQAKFCTKPELEILLIIAEGKLAEFEKLKSKQSPKDFCKQHVLLNCKNYDNSTTFYNNYFGDRIDLLVFAITEYYHTHKKHKSDEGYLFDLLTQQ